MIEQVSIQVAEDEFERWAAAMALDISTADMDAEDRTAFDKQKRRILSAIQNRALVINEEGEAVYTPQNPKTKHQQPLVFHERTGAALMASDGKKKGHEVAKTYAVLASMCEVHPSVFASMVGIDGKVCEALFALLMD